MRTDCTLPSVVLMKGGRDSKVQASDEEMETEVPRRKELAQDPTHHQGHY